mmetsp:Transcript_19032/g.44410  ORF Transcript_19032/g.44410 Transcript_19032/m.44410 type:complete len:199 (+) Transcript_19032:41-637(+)
MKQHHLPLVLAVALLQLLSPAAAFLRSSSRQMRCPMDYEADGLKRDGTHTMLHVPTVANFLEPRVQDTWWDEQHVEEFMKQSDLYRIAPSKIAGCGLIAQKEISAGTRIGLVWVKDPFKGEFAELIPRHFTPWFGRAVNHCPNSNSHLEADAEGSVWSVASVDISAGEEITGNYNEAATQFPGLVEGAPSSWTCDKVA